MRPRHGSNLGAGEALHVGSRAEGKCAPRPSRPLSTTEIVLVIVDENNVASHRRVISEPGCEKTIANRNGLLCCAFAKRIREKLIILQRGLG